MAESAVYENQMVSVLWKKALFQVTEYGAYYCMKRTPW